MTLPGGVSAKYTIIEKTNKKSGRKWYVVTLGLKFAACTEEEMIEAKKLINRHFDPTKSRLTQKQYSWSSVWSYKFKNKNDVEELITMPVLSGWLKKW